MLTLSLLRHAKSAWDDPSLADFDRPLAPRGEKAAPLMARWMERHRIRPDRALVSPALRARQTWEPLALVRDSPLPVTFDEALYLASPRTLLALIRGVPESTRHLLIVGHNPGLHALATAMIGDGPVHLRAALDDKLPTCGLVVLGCDAPRFADLKPGTMRLVEFVTPRGLDGG